MFGQANLAEDPGPAAIPLTRQACRVGFDPDSFRGPSAVDQRHRFVLSGLGRLPFRLELSGIVTVGSGRPFTALSGVDSNGDGVAVNDRARRDPRDPLSRVERNGERMAGTATVDARLSRRFGPVARRGRRKCSWRPSTSSTASTGATSTTSSARAPSLPHPR